MDNRLEIDRLSYKYGSREVLKEISFAISKGSFIGLIGPNGSGKSTLLKNINAILRPDSGSIYLDNLAINNLKPKEIAKKLAVVPQNTDIKFDFTVQEVVLMGRAPYINRFKGESEQDLAIAREAMEATNLIEFKDRYISQLSGGEKQRVIIARSLAQKPEVLLLDEPTANLDINYQLEIMNLLQRLNQNQDLTVLIVLHDLNLAAQYCNELVLLKEGEIYDFGRPKEVITTQNIEEVYGSKVVIRRLYPDDRPYITLIKEPYLLQKNLNKRVHIISGGGTGRELIEDLAVAGLQISCGVLNEKDSDWEVAKRLDLKTVTEEPFAPISSKNHQQNKELISESEVVILTEIPFGFGNLFNLKAALWAAEAGKKVIVVHNKDVEIKDYTKGEGSEIFNKLLTHDIVIVKDNSSVLDCIVDR